MSKVKVAIIGGGIIGCSVAYYLSQRKEYGITLFERLGILGGWETNNSVAMVMHQTGSEYLTKFAKTSIEEYKRFNADDKRIGFEEVGSILYTTNKMNTDNIERYLDIQNSLNIITKRINAFEIKENLPFVNVDDIIVGCYCPSDGFVNPSLTLAYLYEKAKEAGVEFLFSHEAEVITSEENEQKRVKGIKAFRGLPVTLASYYGFGDISEDESPVDISNSEVREVICEMDFDIIINASGGLGDLVASKAGCPLPIENNIRRVGVVVPRESLGKFPILENIDTDKEWYVRPYDNGKALFGEGPVLKHKIKNCNRYDYPIIENDDNDFFDILSEHILHRTPALKDVKMVKSWTGIRSYGNNEKPIIEHSKIVKGLIHCCGMSGFGISIAPACGMEVVKLIINSKGDKN